MCNNESCSKASLHQKQARAIVLEVHQIDELTAERDYWRDLFHSLCTSLGMEPSQAISRVKT